MIRYVFELSRSIQLIQLNSDFTNYSSIETTLTPSQVQWGCTLVCFIFIMVDCTVQNGSGVTRCNCHRMCITLSSTEYCNVALAEETSLRSGFDIWRTSSSANHRKRDSLSRRLRRWAQATFSSNESRAFNATIAYTVPRISAILKVIAELPKSYPSMFRIWLGHRLFIVTTGPEQVKVR